MCAVSGSTREHLSFSRMPLLFSSLMITLRREGDSGWRGPVLWRKYLGEYTMAVPVIFFTSQPKNGFAFSANEAYSVVIPNYRLLAMEGSFSLKQRILCFLGNNEGLTV